MSLQPPTIFQTALSRRNPAHRQTLKARDAEYQALWQLIGRTACRDEYVRATIATRRIILKEVAERLIEKRRQQGRTMCGADVDQMITRHLKKEASDRSKKRAESSGSDMPIRFESIMSRLDDKVLENIDGDLDEPLAEMSPTGAPTASVAPASVKAPVAYMGPDPSVFDTGQPAHRPPSPPQTFVPRYAIQPAGLYPRQNHVYIPQVRANPHSDQIHALEDSFTAEIQDLSREVGILQKENAFLYDQLCMQAERAEAQNAGLRKYINGHITELREDVSWLVREIKALTGQGGEARGGEPPLEFPAQDEEGLGDGDQ